MIFFLSFTSLLLVPFDIYALSDNKTTNAGMIDISIFIGAEYSLGGKTSIECSLFFNNSITNALGSNNDPDALFHQIGIRTGFLF